MKATLYKKVYNKEQFNSVIDNSFKELKQEANPLFYDVNLATIDDFFILYDKFFYDIPKEGDFKSHEYIVKTSNEYVQADLINSTIIALTEEINSLREENLNLLSSTSSKLGETNNVNK